MSKKNFIDLEDESLNIGLLDSLTVGERGLKVLLNDNLALDLETGEVHLGVATESCCDDEEKKSLL